MLDHDYSRRGFKGVSVVDHDEKIVDLIAKLAEADVHHSNLFNCDLRASRPCGTDKEGLQIGIA